MAPPNNAIYDQSRFEEDYKSGQINIVPLVLGAAPEINTCHQSGGAATPGINKPTSEQRKAQDNNIVPLVLVVRT